MRKLADRFLWLSTPQELRRIADKMDKAIEGKHFSQLPDSVEVECFRYRREHGIGDDIDLTIAVDVYRTFREKAYEEMQHDNSSQNVENHVEINPTESNI